MGATVYFVSEYQVTISTSELKCGRRPVQSQRRTSPETPTLPGLNRVDLTWFFWQRLVIRIAEMSSCLVYTRDAPRTNFNKLYFCTELNM